MGWLLDRKKAWMREIWLFEVSRALGTAVTAKAPRELRLFQKKSVSWKLFRVTTQGGYLIL